MKFGFGLITCQRYPGDPRTDRQLYEQALHLVQRAEQLGFDSVWVSEHHFWDDSYMPSLLVFCGAAAALTNRVKLGTGVLLAPLYQRVRLAEDAATVDLISGGRLVLGLGQGWMPHEFEALDIPLAGRHRQFEDTVHWLRETWSGGVSGAKPAEGRGVLVTPMPSQRGGPPIWLGADSRRGMRRAGRIGDGFMSSSAFDANIWAEQVRLVQEGANEVGRELGQFTFSLHRPTFAWHGGYSWERVAPYAHYVAWKYEEMQIVRDRSGPLAAPPELTGEREAQIRGGRGLVGEPERIVEQLSLLQAVTAGELYFVARSYWPGMDPGVQVETMEIFAEEVMGKLRD